jgi:hypothetical protein
MGTQQMSPGPVDLAGWDWKTELKAQERSLEWLARRTQRSTSAVNGYSAGRMIPPASWLAMAAQVLGVEVAGDD